MNTLVFRGTASAPHTICFLCIREWEGGDRPDYTRIAKMTVSQAHSVLAGTTQDSGIAIVGSVPDLSDGQVKPGRLTVSLRDDFTSLEQRPWRLQLTFPDGAGEPIGYLSGSDVDDLRRMKADIDIVDDFESEVRLNILRDTLLAQRMRDDAAALCRRADALDEDVAARQSADAAYSNENNM